MRNKFVNVTNFIVAHLIECPVIETSVMVNKLIFDITNQPTKLFMFRFDGYLERWINQATGHMTWQVY